jgi:hypothetical protein
LRNSSGDWLVSIISRAVISLVLSSAKSVTEVLVEEYLAPGLAELLANSASRAET